MSDEVEALKFSCDEAECVVYPGKDGWVLEVKIICEPPIFLELPLNADSAAEGCQDAFRKLDIVADGLLALVEAIKKLKVQK